MRVPGDKSISHRALMFGALATGGRASRGLLEAEDVINTAQARCRRWAARSSKTGDELGGARAAASAACAQPARPLDFGNSGTGTRLMMGVIAGHDMTVRLTGDASLSPAADGPRARRRCSRWGWRCEDGQATGCR